MIFLSEALSVEYESKGIIIQTVTPCFVDTNMTTHYKKKKMVFMVKADECVSQALNSVGIEWTTYGHRTHKFLGFLMENIIQPVIGCRNYMKLVYARLEKVVSKRN
jgi:short-subunit dehydrogenase